MKSYHREAGHGLVGANSTDFACASRVPAGATAGSGIRSLGRVEREQCAALRRRPGLGNA